MENINFGSPICIELENLIAKFCRQTNCDDVSEVSGNITKGRFVYTTPWGQKYIAVVRDGGIIRHVKHI